MKIGIDIGGNHISIGVVDGKNVIEKKEYEIREFVKNNTEKDIKKYILDILIQGIKGFSEYNLRKITIACCGVIKEGVIINSPNLKIYKFELVEELKKEFIDYEILLRNDAKCAAIAEKNYGVLKDYKEAVFLTIGTGIGGAYFLDNKLVEPKRGSGFEFGHVVINLGGKECTCGSKGCFEKYASITALKEMVKNEFGINEILTGKELYDFIFNGLKNINTSDRIEKILEEYSKKLALGISNIINILEPEVIVFGGSIVHYEDLLLNKVKEKLYIFNKEAGNPDIKMAVLGNEAGIIGE